MPIAQLYETSIVDTDLGLAADFMVVPPRSLPDELARSPDRLKAQLALGDFTPIEPGWLVPAVATLLAHEDASFLHNWPSVSIDLSLSPPFLNRHYLFAEYLLVSRVVPFETSPLSPEALGDLITRASGVGLGAYVGFVVAGGTPLVFVLVPAGMLVLGASAGVARGLEEGLRSRVRRLIER